jgi:hypothetical protein
MTFKRDNGDRTTWAIGGDIGKAANRVDLRMPVVEGGATYALDSRVLMPRGGNVTSVLGAMICAEMRIRNSTNRAMTLLFYTLGTGANGTWRDTHGNAVDLAVSDCPVPTAYMARGTTAPYNTTAAPYGPTPTMAPSSVAGAARTTAPYNGARVGAWLPSGALGAAAPIPMPRGQRLCIDISGTYGGAYVAPVPPGAKVVFATCPARKGLYLLVGLSVGALATFDLRQPVLLGGRKYAHTARMFPRGETMAICLKDNTRDGAGPFMTVLAFTNTPDGRKDTWRTTFGASLKTEVTNRRLC